ncbi:MAG: mitochondrial TOM complex subunit Tom40 [Amphiamblys sp. WSBS2006]|nr:MAG: mitochondrial TOM complex subunit Tom40 [Amphiamblys sp. WSBS2006]
MSFVRRLLGCMKNSEGDALCSYDAIHREANNTSPNAFLFSNLKAQIGHSLLPSVYLQHGLTIDNVSSPSSYTISGVLSSYSRLLQLAVEPSTRTLQGLAKVSALSRLHLRAHGQYCMGDGSRYTQIETEYTGSNTNATLKMINPTPGNIWNGFFGVSGLQNISKTLSLGGEFLFRAIKSPFEIEKIGKTLSLRYTPNREATFAATIQNSDTISSSYYQRINRNVEMATEIQASVLKDTKKTIASTALKIETEKTTARAVVDTSGRVAVWVEEKLLDDLSVLLCGEIERWNTVASLGFGLCLEQ